MENELLKEAVEMAAKKSWTAHVPLLPEDGDKPCQSLPPGLTCATACHGPSVEELAGSLGASASLMILTRWPYPYRYGELPTNGYRRVWALLRNNQKLTTWRLSMPNAYTASCVRMRCCLSVNCNTAIEAGAYRESGRRRNDCGGALTASSSGCDNGETACHVRTGLLRSRGTVLGGRVPVDMTANRAGRHAGCGGATLRQQPADIPSRVADRQRFSLPFSSDASVRQNGRTGA